MKSWVYLVGVVVAAEVSATGCSSSSTVSGAGETSRVQTRLVANGGKSRFPVPGPSETYTSIVVTIEQVRARRSGTTATPIPGLTGTAGLIVLSDGPKEIDLAAPGATTALLLGDRVIPSTKYDQIGVTFAATNATVTTTSGETFRLEMPSGEVLIPASLGMSPAVAYTLTLGIDAQTSVRREAPGIFLFTPGMTIDNFAVTTLPEPTPAPSGTPTVFPTVTATGSPAPSPTPSPSGFPVPSPRGSPRPSPLGFPTPRIAATATPSPL